MRRDIIEIHQRIPWLWLILRFSGGIIGVICILALPFLVAARVLPRGDWIAFMYNADETRDQDYDIYLLDTQSGLSMPFIASSMNERFPEWSPDGSQIAYHADPVETWRFDLFVADADGSNIRRLQPEIERITNYDALYYDEAMVSWSPDGSQIVFHSGATNAISYQSYRYNFETGKTTLLIKSGSDVIFPVWSPDGKRMAFAVTREMHVPSYYAYQEIAELYVMVFDSTATSVPLMPDEVLRIPERLTMMDVSLANVQKLTAGDDIYFPSWSPDGTMIAYTLDTGLGEEIYVINADGTGERRLTTTRYARNRHPEWLPDGRGIIFASDRSGSFDIYRINIDGTGERRLTFLPGSAEAPSWKPRRTGD